MTRTLLTNAIIIDGSGGKKFKGSILVTDAKIDKVIREGEGLPSHDVLTDLRGLVLAPGFIDVHSHADNAPFLSDADTSKILQGVTTEVIGNCGFSLAPRSSGSAEVFEKYSLRIFPELDWRWETFGEFLSAADSAGYVTNIAPLIGHHSLRIAVMAMENRAPSAEEIKLMLRFMDEALDAGVFGMSTGLIYPPGVFAQHEEISALVRNLPDNAIYTTHMRGEGVQLFQSIAEALRVGEETGRRVQISHLKAAGRPNWGRMNEALEKIEAARSRGVIVTQDIYPYTAGSTMLTACLPPWFQEGGNDRVIERLKDKKALKDLSEEIEQSTGDWENMIVGAGWNGIVVSSTGSHNYESESLEAIGKRLGIAPLDALVKVLLAEELRASMIVHQMSEEDVVTALQNPYTMIGSDGLPPGTGGRPHPRTYGTFPRILARYSRELGVFDLEEAVRRMTSLPASTFGLTDRGVIAVGKQADLVCFDPEKIQDLATFDDPVQTPQGIPWVMVNGSVTVQDGIFQGSKFGQRLTRKVT